MHLSLSNWFMKVIQHRMVATVPLASGATALGSVKAAHDFPILPFSRIPP